MITAETALSMSLRIAGSFLILSFEDSASAHHLAGLHRVNDRAVISGEHRRIERVFRHGPKLS